jgi:hypothetical protein
VIAELAQDWSHLESSQLLSILMGEVLRGVIPQG